MNILDSTGIAHMLEKLSLPEFMELAKKSKRVAVFQEILADRLTPIGIVENLADKVDEVAVLESGLKEKDGRYTFIAFDRIAQLKVEKGVVSQCIGGVETVCNMHPFTALRQLSETLSCAVKNKLVKFIGGSVGFIAYDAVRVFEAIPDRHSADASLPDMLFNFYQTTLAFDHFQEKLLISTIVDVHEDAKNSYQVAQEKLNSLIETLSAPLTSANMSSCNKENNKTVNAVDISDTEFMHLVTQAKKYITQGDAFQIVLSRCFQQRYTVHPFEIYRSLRQTSPAPYMFYLPIAQRVILGASPEKLISVHDRQVEINPIAGTRKKTDQDNIDRIQAELMNDPKEQAEHMMLVDLARNDIGGVCKPGSVKVNELMQIKHFSHVSHLTSIISGELHEHLDALDALAAAFPAGTLSGAPKIRAMEIIDELETSRRGMYGGAICRLDQRGNLDSCIAIRMAVLKDGVATVRAGAGIVHDSDPVAETNETRYKAQGILDAIISAQEQFA